MKIKGRNIGDNCPGYIIAEAGTNHFGGRDRALRLALAAKEAGADAIKFQAFVPDAELFCPYPGDEDRIPYWNKTALPYDQWEDVAQFCTMIDIHFILSVFQTQALQFLDLCDAAKVASRAAETFPYDKTDLPLIISAGMSEPPPVIRDHMILDCIPEYPTPLNKAMSLAIVARGLSDHSGTPWPAIVALNHHCPIIEVHFHGTDREESRDRAVELTTDQLKMICDFRDAMAA